MTGWRDESNVQVYLPSSSVCCQLEPIPFHITLFADERTLEPFAEYRPMPSSFLPISGSASYASFESVQTHLSARKAAHKPAPEAPSKQVPFQD